MTIQRKLLLFLIAAALLTSVAVGIISAQILARAVRAATLERVRDEVGLLAFDVAQIKGEDDLSAWVDRVAARLALRVTIVNPAGVVVADSSVARTQWGGIENHGDRPEIKQARIGGSGEDFRMSSTMAVDYFYFARRIDAAERSGFVRIALPSSELERFDRTHLWLLIVTVACALGLLSILAYFVVRRIARPIEEMTATAELVAAGNLNVEVPCHTNDELGRLGATVNRMKNALLKENAERLEEHRLLEVMTDRMEEGLLLLGPDHRILMANASLTRIFRIAFEPIGHLLAEVVRHPTVINEVELALQSGEDRRATVSGTPLSDRSFEVHTRRVEIPGGEGRSGVLVLFFDITRIEALEGVRKQFVADVSHELRTPMTSIAGAIETLIDGGFVDHPEAKHFLEIAHRQSSRMAELISDLTDLSLIETGAIELQLLTFELAPVVDEVLAVARQRGSERGIELRSEVPPSLIIRADRRRLEQILVNLVDNGVKFNRQGGTVCVRGFDRGDRTEIVVEDTGVGIPRESLDRIFQRFYRVDRARSREALGTGLGLAIVKHLVQLHDGEVRVESEIGQGARFIVELPRR